MSRALRYILPCYLFALPMTVVGFVLAVVFYRVSSWAWHDGVLGCAAGRAQDGTTRIFGKPNAQTWGWLVVYDSEESRQCVDLRVHEYAHVAQAFACSIIGLALCPVAFALAGASPVAGLVHGGFLGALGFVVAYGLSFFFFLAVQRNGWFSAYWSIPFEVQARGAQDHYLANTSSRPWGV